MIGIPNSRYCQAQGIDPELILIEWLLYQTAVGEERDLALYRAAKEAKLLLPDEARPLTPERTAELLFMFGWVD